MLLGRTWQMGLVKTMLGAASGEMCRPDSLPAHYGVQPEGYCLSPEQAQAILELRLHRLTALEQEKIFQEFEALIVAIQALLNILASPERLMQVIREELLAIRTEFGDKRLTEIRDTEESLSVEDLIPEETVVVTLSHQGYVKYQPISTYTAQHRGGKGKAAMNVKEEDEVTRLIIANTHDTLLCFSTAGKLYWIKVYQLPLASRTARGKPIVNVLSLSSDEFITAMLPVRTFDENHFVFMATRKGTVKKVSLEAFSRPRANGIIAVELLEGDRLVGVDITDGTKDIMLFTDTGKVVRFAESGVRAMGRLARGVRGIKLKTNQAVVSLVVIEGDGTILTATENGYGKRTQLSEYSVSGRGGIGVISIQVTARNGKVVRSEQVKDTDQVLLITDQGTLVRFKVDELSVIGRNTQGVRLMSIHDTEKVVGMQRIQAIESLHSEQPEPMEAEALQEASDD